MFDDDRPITRRVGVCRECRELTLSVADDADRRDQLVCRMTFRGDDKVPPRVDLPEEFDEEKVDRYERRRVPRQCIRLETYDTVSKLGVL